MEEEARYGVISVIIWFPLIIFVLKFIFK
jgi:hypothetical protein